MSMSPEMVEFLRQQFPKGSRIELKEQDGNTTYRLPPGSKGTLDQIDDSGVFDVQWDSGEYLGISIGQDRFSVEQPEAHTMKLYAPLYADIIGYNVYGDLDDVEGAELDSRELVRYEDKIVAALVRERMPEEAERGIMHWYHGDDGVDRKVRSVVFNAEERNGRLWGVAECRVVGELTPQELETLTEYLTGQMSDGAGESFEQHEIKIDEGELYVHMWSSAHDWSLQTEEKCFGPKVAAGLPDLCFSVIKSTGELICIKRGVEGYFPSDWNTPDRERNEEIAADQNQRLGVTEAQRQAMECGSMCGWQAPGANPKWYETHQPQMGGMTLG